MATTQEESEDESDEEPPALGSGNVAAATEVAGPTPMQLQTDVEHLISAAKAASCASTTGEGPSAAITAKDWVQTHNVLRHVLEMAPLVFPCLPSLSLW